MPKHRFFAGGRGAGVLSGRVECTDVYNSAGDKLGSIDHLMIDRHSGQVRYAVMEFGGFLGMAADRYPLQWNMLKYDTTKESDVVPLDTSKLENAPRYPDGDAPAYTPAIEKVNTFYGVD